MCTSTKRSRTIEKVPVHDMFTIQVFVNFAAVLVTHFTHGYMVAHGDSFYFLPL